MPVLSKDVEFVWDQLRCKRCTQSVAITPCIMLCCYSPVCIQCAKESRKSGYEHCALCGQSRSPSYTVNRPLKQLMHAVKPFLIEGMSVPLGNVQRLVAKFDCRKCLKNALPVPCLTRCCCNLICLSCSRAFGGDRCSICTKPAPILAAYRAALINEQLKMLLSLFESAFKPTSPQQFLRPSRQPFLALPPAHNRNQNNVAAVNNYNNAPGFDSRTQMQHRQQPPEVYTSKNFSKHGQQPNSRAPRYIPQPPHSAAAAAGVGNRYASVGTRR